MKLHEAEQQIGAILKQLEIDSEQLIDSINIIEIDVSDINSSCKELQARVDIRLRPKIARRW